MREVFVCVLVCVNEGSVRTVYIIDEAQSQITHTHLHQLTFGPYLH
jgi:hypothetical protein